MKTLVLFSLLLLTLSAHAQIAGEVTRVEDYDHNPGTQKLPVSIDLKGNIKFHLTGGSPDYSLSPKVAVDFKRTTINYVSPIPFEVFALEEAFPYQPWIEFRTSRKEIGLGIDFKAPFKLGILPYKGSFESTVVLRGQSRSWRSTSLPARLEELTTWSVNDSGDYQTYGGIVIEASMSAPLSVSIGTEVGIQNNFIVSLKKLSADSIELALIEEKLNSRRLKFGASVVKGSLASMNGRLLHSRFLLELSNPEHHVLYRKALQGRIIELQRSLNHTSQKIAWTGTDRRFYFGIPSVAGEERDWMDFKYHTSDEGLYIWQKRTKGMLTKFREHKNYIYHNARGIIILWTSKMKKVSVKELEKKFINRGLVLHLQGFEENHSVRSNMLLGSLITQMGIAFTREEIEGLNEEGLRAAGESMLTQCRMKFRRCSEQKYQAIMSKVRAILQQPWPSARRHLGVMLSNNPELIYSLIKGHQLQKKAYVKFLSQKYQSLEGTAEVRL